MLHCVGQTALLHCIPSSPARRRRIGGLRITFRAAAAPPARRELAFLRSVVPDVAGLHAMGVHGAGDRVCPEGPRSGPAREAVVGSDY